MPPIDNLGIWDAETRVVVGEPLEGHTRAVQSVAYSPNGQHIISGFKDRSIQIWDSEIGTAVGKPLERCCPLLTLPNGKLVTSGSNDKTIRTWDAETSSPVGKPLEGHIAFVMAVIFSPSGQQLVSASNNRSI